MTHLESMPWPRIVFIGGLHRSGTSLLFQALREHPLVSGFRDTGVPEDEGQHLQSVYPPARAHGGPGHFGFAPQAHLTEASPLVTDYSRETLLREWGVHWDLTKPVLLEKSPPNLIRTRFLQALFPSSSFLMLLRHPLAVAYATKKWTNASLSSLIEHWLLCYSTFDRDRQHLKSSYIVRYENLVKDPATLGSVQTFLGLAAHDVPVHIRPDLDDAYLVKWREARQRQEDSDDAKRIEDRFGERIARFGYSLEVDRPYIAGAAALT